MSLRHNKSVTLLELLIAVSILGLVVAGLSSIDIFSHRQVLTTDRRSKTQNEASYVLEHISKEIAKAIGNVKIDRTSTDGDEIVNIDIATTSIKVYVDLDPDGISAGDGRRDMQGDHWIAYRYVSSGQNEHQIQYCPRCTNPTCTQCTPNWDTSSNILSSKITSPPTFTYTPGNDYVDAQLIACWDPARTDCGSSDNPSVSMKARIMMPGVSIH